MHASRRSCALALALSFFMVPHAQAQAGRRPVLHALRDVRLLDTADAPHKTLILREGRIEAILDSSATVPDEATSIEGHGAFALPAFVDAYSFTGCEMPKTVAERDLPPKAGADLFIDMREANRKGILPSFRAVDTFKLEAEVQKRWRSSGFGYLLSAPHGQLLSGASTLCCTRETPARDAVLVASAFDHAGFESSGPGYPGTLMGGIAQLRQFFLDARWSHDLAERANAGKAGRRAPYDADLDALTPALAKKRRIVAEAETAGDIERWIKLSDEFSFELAISGGREAYKRAELLATRKIPVFLTLEWGEEPDDPHAKEKDKGKKGKEGSKKPKGEEKPDSTADPKPEPKPESKPEVKLENKPEAKPEVAPDAKPDAKPLTKPEPKTEGKPEVKAENTQDPKPDAKSETKPDAKADTKPDAKANAKPDAKAKDEWTYEEPMRVREEKRRLWEEARDGAIVLAKAGVVLHFGTGKANPKDLLEKLRGLVERGLPLEVAHAALGANEAALLGLEKHLGELSVGAEASIALWSADPLKSKEAKLNWLFIEGFPHEFEVKSNELLGKPDDDVDASGTWTFEIERAGPKPLRAELTMQRDGALKAKVFFRTPASEDEREAEFEGKVAGKKFQFGGKFATGNFESTVEFEGELDGNTMSGELHWKSARRDDTNAFKGTRPKYQERAEQGERDDDEHPRGGQ